MSAYIAVTQPQGAQPTSEPGVGAFGGNQEARFGLAAEGAPAPREPVRADGTGVQFFASGGQPLNTDAAAQVYRAAPVPMGLHARPTAPADVVSIGSTGREFFAASVVNPSSDVFIARTPASAYEPPPAPAPGPVSVGSAEVSFSRSAHVPVSSDIFVVPPPPLPALPVAPLPWAPGGPPTVSNEPQQILPGPGRVLVVDDGPKLAESHNLPLSLRHDEVQLGSTNLWGVRTDAEVRLGAEGEPVGAAEVALGAIGKPKNVKG